MRLPGAESRRLGRRVGLDRALLLAYTLMSFAFMQTTSLTPHRTWAEFATPSYACALAISVHPKTRRFAPYLALAGSLVLPLVYLVINGLAQPELRIITEGAQRFIAYGSPYPSDPLSLDAMTPYLPAMFLFGIPRALGLNGPSGDPRLWIGATLLGVLVWITTDRPLGATPADRRVERSNLALFLSFPLVALTLSVSAIDIPMCAASVLALDCYRRRHFVATGFLSGLALAMKPTALFLVVALAAAMLRRGPRSGLRPYLLSAVSTFGAAVIAPLLLDAHAMWVNTVAFPAGLTAISSPAQSPLPGVLLAEHLPGGPTIARVLLLIAIGGGCFFIWRSAPKTVAGISRQTAIALCVAICAAPNSRVGYFVYPLALWAMGSLSRRWSPDLTGDLSGKANSPNG